MAGVKEVVEVMVSPMVIIVVVVVAKVRMAAIVVNS